MAKSNEDLAKSLEEVGKEDEESSNNGQQDIKETKAYSSNRKRKRQIEDRELTQESSLEDGCEDRYEDPEEEVITKRMKNEISGSKSEELIEENIELSLKLLCDRIRKTPPKKAWNLHKEQCALAKKAKIDLAKNVYDIECDEDLQQDSVKRNEFSGKNKEECTESRTEIESSGHAKDKTVITLKSKREYSVESPKTGSKGFSNASTSSELPLSGGNENRSEERERNEECKDKDCEKTEKCKIKDCKKTGEEPKEKDDCEKTGKECKEKDDCEESEKECKEKDDCEKSEKECKEKDDCEKTEEGLKEKDDCDKTEDDEEDSEDSPSPHRTRETETETDDTDQEEFSTEGLLKELHFLNTSCEKPFIKKNTALQSCRTPKKRKLDFGAVPQGSTAFSIPVKNLAKKISPRKRIRSNSASPDKSYLWKTVTDGGITKEKSPYTSPSKLRKSPTTDKEVHMNANGEESDEVEEGSLTIVAPKEKPKKRKGMGTPPRLKRIRHGVESGEVPQELIELIQSGIDEALEEKAERTQLTAIHVKNIIKNVMTDDNVLAMVRNTVMGMHDNSKEAPAVYEPTLTRAKTKELMEQQAAGVGNGNIWAGLSNSSAGGSTILNPETQALATTDFPDEDEDEEYTPEADEHLHSDDESLVSSSFNSETGSPSTPCTPSTSCVSSTPGSSKSLSTPVSSSLKTPVNRLLVFKLPEIQRKTVQRVLSFENVPKKEEKVSQRTRSKLPLTETPLECLEMAFKPPDVTKDMYETEVIDDDWKGFLIDFIHPLKSTEVGEDEDADPEYNILEDKEDALDLREEMRGDRAVQISKKEINELMTELLDTLGNDEETEPVRMHLSQHISQKEAKKSPFKMPQICQPSTDKEAVPSPGAIWVEILTAQFTKTQLDILKCQMTQHVQQLTTSSLMCYGSSLLDDISNGCIKSLEELKRNADASGRNTFFCPFNLEPALVTIEKFKRESSKNLSSDLQQKTYVLEVHPLVLEIVLKSSAFPFPRLLPTRMFQHPNNRKYAKTTFVPPEDMLMAIGLERYLDPKYRKTKCKKSQYRLLLAALSLTVENVLVAKTVSQATNRIKNIRSRLKDSPKHPLLVFLETGELELPQVEVEPLLPCVPCIVESFPEVSLCDYYQKVARKRHIAEKEVLLTAATEAAKKVAIAKEYEMREAEFRGVRISQNPIQNIVIIQAPVSNQLLVPQDVVLPIMSYPCSVDESVRINSQPLTYYAQIGNSSQSSSCGFSLHNVQPNATAIISDNIGSTVMTSLTPDPSSHSLPPQKVTDKVPGDTPNVILSKNIASNGSDAKGKESTSQLKASGSECKPMNEEEDLNNTDDVMDDSAKLNTNDDDGTVHSESYNRIRRENVSQNQETVDEDNFDSCTINEYISELNVESKENETAENNNENKSTNVSLEEKTQSVLAEGFLREVDSIPKTPEKIQSTTQSNIPTVFLPMSSLLATPTKSDEGGAATVSLSMSLLSTPEISASSPDKSLHTPVKAVSEVKRTNFSSILEKSEIASLRVSSNLERHLEPVVPGNKDRLLKSSIPLPSAEVDKEKGCHRGKEKTTVDEVRNSDVGKTKSSGKHSSVQNRDKTREKQMSAVAHNQVTPQSSSLTLVTSVYQSPILSSGVRKTDSSNVLNITPPKPKASSRRISPAKGFRSPMKTSPLKQVSPILRKYHKYSPKKRRLMSSNKKLSPILPKMSHRSSPRQRRLAPKPSKSSSVVENGVRARGSNSRRATGSDSFLHCAKRSCDSDLLQLDDLMDSNVSTSRSCDLSQPAAKVHPSEDDFEEDFLEDEDEEDEDEEDEDEEEEEEDLQAAQQREEHLAALLKASSTITLKRGGGGDGLEKKLNGVGDLSQGERRLTKQQRRLQARISALSNVPEATTQDKLVAQSYLMRVREALLGKDPAAYKELLFLLTEFTLNSGNSPVELYNQLREVMKEFPHLSEEFVSFLLPEQAMAIGKYAQYCVIHRMRDFLEKLELQFSKQPQIIQKIIRLLQSLQSRPDLNIEDVKAAMTPLLKYPHLIECFTQCFPSQPPAPSLQSDFEDVSLENAGSDSMESLVLPDDDVNTSPSRCVCSCHASDSNSPTAAAGSHHNPTNAGRSDHCLSCALRFSEGRVYLQCGKTLRPARVTFQTADPKKEEFDEKNTQSSVVGGNVTSECSETSTKGKHSGKGKLSQTKDPNENAHARSKESVRVVPSTSISSNANSTTTHVSNSSALRNRIIVTSEEKGLREDTGNQTEKKDSKGRGDDVVCVNEPVVSRSVESTCSTSEIHTDGKNPTGKKTCPTRSYERTEMATHTDSSLAKSSSQNKTSSFQNNAIKGKGLAVENSRPPRNKETPMLQCSPPKEIHDENAVLPSCSKTSTLINFRTMGELLAHHVSVIDERNKPSASAVIVTDRIELQKEHKATLCHAALKVPNLVKTNSSHSSDSETTFHKTPSVNSSKTSSLNSAASVKTSISIPMCSTPSTSTNIETRKTVDVSEDARPPLTQSSLSSQSTVPVSSTPTTSLEPLRWTKDEDQTILTVVQQKGVTDVVLQEIADALPLRDFYQVHARFNTLVKLMMEDTDFEDSISISSEDSTI